MHFCSVLLASKRILHFRLVLLVPHYSNLLLYGASSDVYVYVYIYIFFGVCINIGGLYYMNTIRF